MSIVTGDVWTRVEAPPVVPHPYGLFSVAPPASPADPHWQMGARWKSRGCETVGVTTDPCITGDAVPPPKAHATCLGSIDVKPLTVYAAATRSGDTADTQSDAEAILALGEERAVETYLWGVLQQGVTEGPGGPPLTALALVEAALADGYLGTGVIHMSRSMAVLLTQYLVQKGGHLETIVGTPVVAGGGYGVTAIYGTGALLVLRDAPSVLQNWNTASNDLSALAERTYLAGWDCFAVGETVTTA